jgi:hypothetical protein
MAAGLGVCPSCGGSNLEEDSIHALVACTDCGTALQGEFTDGAVSMQRPAATFTRSLEGSKEQIRVFSDKAYSSKKLGRLIKTMVKMAEAVKLPKAVSSICVDQAKELNRRDVVGRGSMRIDNVCAALAYVAWKRQNASVSAWDMMNTGVKPNVLIKVTERLCTQHPDLVSVNKEDPPTDEERLNLRLDRFLPVNGEERRRVVAIALDIWSLVREVKVQDLHIQRIPIHDYCILAVALEFVRRKKLPKSEINALAKNITMTHKTVGTVS